MFLRGRISFAIPGVYCLWFWCFPLALEPLSRTEITDKEQTEHSDVYM